MAQKTCTSWHTDDEMLSLVGEMRKRRIPIDVFVVDMDWHFTVGFLYDMHKLGPPASKIEDLFARISAQAVNKHSIV